MLRVEDISKSYSGHKALTNISFEVPKGTVYGLLGPNGAGKTTLIRIINHITAPDTGYIYLDGKKINQNDIKHIGYLPEERGLYKKMKVGEQAMFFARLKGMSANEARKELKHWFDKFQIMSWWNKKVEELSKGMAQKLQFIVTVIHKPKLLIFDEPFSGFDPINANLLTTEILNLKNNGTTIILSTHNMASVESLCENITLINNSRNILTGNVNEIRQNIGKRRFMLTFRGDTERLLTSLGELVENISFESNDNMRDTDFTNVTFRIKSQSDFREIIDISNRTVELQSFTRALPSIDEIFINAVNTSS